MSLYDWIRSWGPAYAGNHGYYWLPIAGMALVGLAWLLWNPRLAERIAPGRLRIARGILIGILVAASVFSLAVYNNFFHYHYGGYLNAYEFFHYYLGSKYSREIGYFDLYGAALAADAETGLLYRPPDGRIRDLRSLEYVPVTTVLADRDRYRRRFSGERWEEWVRDVSFFKARLGATAWNRILRDRGYNATPVWTMIVGSTLSNRIPTRSSAGMTFLALLDVILLATAFTCVGWVFGSRQALLMVVFLASCYLMAHVHMKGAFLRTDFAVALLLAMCALKTRHHATAGALVGYATSSRVFPAVFAAGLAARFAWDLLGAGLVAIRTGRWRRVTTPYPRFFWGFAATLGLLSAASVVYAGGIGPWIAFTEKISVHRSEYHTWNVGLPSVVGADLRPPGGEAGEGGFLERLRETEVTLSPETLRARALATRILQAAIMLLWLLAIRGLEDHDVLATGFVPAFLLVAPTYYYYVVLLLPFLFLAERLERPSGALGLVYMFFSGMTGYWLYFRWDQRFPTYYWSSMLAFGLALYLVAVALMERRRAFPSAIGPAPAPGRRSPGAGGSG